MSRIVVMAGGTGGHIFPALSVAEILRASGCEVTWLGSRGGMEQTMVPRAGFEGDWISIAGVRGKGLRTKIAAPFRLCVSVFQALLILRKRQPAVVLGMGGFASGLGGIAAWLLRRPVIIHEQNAIAGTTNRILSRIAHQVFEAFPQSFSDNSAVKAVGNPVRADILALPLPANRMSDREGAVRILVLGGSQGALILNEYVPTELMALAESVEIEVRHQAGSNTLDVARKNYARAGFSFSIDAFIGDMADAYGWADIVICRAGALTVSELAAAGLASVLVPFPHAIDDHQTANAQFLVKLGAARLLPQSDLFEGVLKNLLNELISDRHRLLTMAEAARQFAHPDAASLVAARCIEIAAEVRA